MGILNKSNICHRDYSAPAAEICETLCGELLCQSPQFDNEEFGGFQPYDPWH